METGIPTGIRERNGAQKEKHFLRSRCANKRSRFGFDQKNQPTHIRSNQNLFPKTDFSVNIKALIL